MAKRIQTVSFFGDAGCMGINTEISPKKMPQGFVKEARNMNYDRFGAELVTRPAVSQGPQTGSDYVDTFKAYSPTSTSSEIYSIVSSGSIQRESPTTTLGSLGGTSQGTSIAQLGDTTYFFSEGQNPKYSVFASGTSANISAHGSYSGTVPTGGVAISAFGRLWVKSNSAPSTIYWSDALVGAAWTGGSSGSLDMTNVWPHGQDQIIQLAEHNGLLVVFGRRQIVLLTGADEAPASNLSYYDSIGGVGLTYDVLQKAVARVRGDLYFLSLSGLVSLGRAIQEKSLPLTSLSNNVDEDIRNLLADSPDYVGLVYDEFNQNVLLSLESLVYCFDVSRPLPDGSLRTTTWDGLEFAAGFFDPDAQWMRLASTDARGLMYLLNQYSGNNSDVFDAYVKTHPAYFGASSDLKLPKNLRVTWKTTETITSTASDFISYGISLDYSDSFDMTDSAGISASLLIGESATAISSKSVAGSGVAIAAKVLWGRGAGGTGTYTWNFAELHDIELDLLVGRAN